MKVKCEKCGAKEKYLQPYEDDDVIYNCFTGAAGINTARTAWYYFCNKCNHVQPK